MASHPWLPPSVALVKKIARARATGVLRKLGSVNASRLGPHAPAWRPFLAALPALLDADADGVLHAVGRVDVLPVLHDLTNGSVDADRLERALVTLWLAIAGNPGLASPLALPGPFATSVVDPGSPRLLALHNVRGIVATARGPVVVGNEGRRSIDACAAVTLPAAEGTVIVDENLGPPDADVVARVQTALTVVSAALPGGRLERVTIGRGDAVCGEARVGPDANPAALVASAQAAFVKAAAEVEPLLGAGGVVVEDGRRVAAIDVLARACGNAVALPWRADRDAAAGAIGENLADVGVLAEATAAGASLVAALRALIGEACGAQRHALLVNVDADDFVYSFQFGRSVERRCAERNLRVDRLAINTGVGRDLAAEIGAPVPAPVADGTEFLMDSERDPQWTAALRRFAARRYAVVVANVRPGQFCDLVANGLLAAPALIWDRHLHGGLREECSRRGIDVDRVRALPIHAWSLANRKGEGLHASLAAAGIEHGTSHVWPLDIEFFQSSATPHADRLFAGGNNGRDWPLLVEAVRGLPVDVHLVTAAAPRELPRRVQVDAWLPLCRFRDAMAAAAVTAVPLLRDAAAGVTVVPMAMALGVAVVATRNQWTEQYVTDGEDGLLVPAGDVRALRTALARLYEDAELRARLVANARQRVAALCDLEAFTGEMFTTLG